MTPIKLMLVDDHSIVRDGIRLLLEQNDDLAITDEAGDGEEALEKLKNHTDAERPDIVLMDISMPGMTGIQTTQAVTKQYKHVKVLVLSMHNNEDYILRSVEAGAAGYILKDSSSEEMLKAIRTIAAGRNIFRRQWPLSSSMAICTSSKKGSAIAAVTALSFPKKRKRFCNCW